GGDGDERPVEREGVEGRERLAAEREIGLQALEGYADRQGRQRERAVARREGGGSLRTLLARVHVDLRIEAPGQQQARRPGRERQVVERQRRDAAGEAAAIAEPHRAVD